MVEPGQSGHRRLAGVADHPRPDPGGGLRLGRHHHRPRPRRRSRCWPPTPTRRPTRPSTPASPCTGASTTSPCATGSSWPPRSATRTGHLHRRRPVPDGHRVLGLRHGRPDRSHPATSWPGHRYHLHDCGDPNLLPDSATDVGAVVARVAGFATVSLQMRGTGLLGWRLRPLRLPVRLRRLRRHRDRGPPELGRQPQGRHGGHQLLRSVAAPLGRAPIRPTWPPSPR